MQKRGSYFLHPTRTPPRPWAGDGFAEIELDIVGVVQFESSLTSCNSIMRTTHSECGFAASGYASRSSIRDLLRKFAETDGLDPSALRMTIFARMYDESAMKDSSEWAERIVVMRSVFRLTLHPQDTIPKPHVEAPLLARHDRNPRLDFTLSNRHDPRIHVPRRV